MRVGVAPSWWTGLGLGLKQPERVSFRSGEGTSDRGLSASGGNWNRDLDDREVCSGRDPRLFGRNSGLMPLVWVLGTVSLLVATLSTVGVFLRFRTATLGEIRLRLTALEQMVSDQGESGDLGNPSRGADGLFPER